MALKDIAYGYDINRQKLFKKKKLNHLVPTDVNKECAVYVND